MVFFTCNACGESVKKVQVEKHVSVCRSCDSLSCIDCGKDFWGDDYKNHVKCVSEDQKYGGKGYEGKTHKGDVKQQAWIQKINELIKKPNVSPKVKELLEQISAYDNVPRKKAKFQNWMKNSLKVHNDSVLEQVWSIFAEASSAEPVSTGQAQPPPDQVADPRAETPAQLPASKAGEATAKPAEAKKKKRERKGDRQKEEPELENHQETPKGQKPKKCKKGQGAGLEANGEDTPTANGSARKRSKKKRQGEEAADGGGAGQEEMTSAVGKRKRKHAEAETESKKKKMKLAGQAEGGEVDEQQPVKGKFNWKGTIKAVLKQAPDNEISIKKLRKKVLAQYYTVTSDCHKSEEELLVIFNKKISKNPTFRLLKDKVKLLK
ncbi:cell growth-regulating nucleolar protein [Lepus europaeus]|uniref:cell growth-regulating nucleolar protein n=1 Tax=Lepus europaeus TaxID=9983 RepID=UPI002B45EC72|nr:cell growth-regulating nucleolar protein [Lepus europaeus]XP_062068917.1 cell growth-regulating nucleolar protein [Lepus europaeus]